MKYSTLILHLVIIFLCCGGKPAAAQVYAGSRLLNTSNGLSDNRVNCFYKDRAGFMWIGTRNGLNRFDGHAFKIFRPGTGNSISNEIINSVTGDSNGNIWVGTMNGLNKYDPVRNHWQTIMPEAGNTKTGLPNNLVWDIHGSEDSILWIASDVFEFSSYNMVSHQFTKYDWPAFAATLPQSSSSHYTSIQKFAAKSTHEFWLGTTKGLVLLDTRSGKFTLLGAGYTGTVRALLYDKLNEKVFLCTDGGKSFCYDEKQASYTQLNTIAEAYPSVSLPATTADEYWLPSPNGIIKTTGQQVSRLSGHIPGFAGSLLPGAVNTVYTDNHGMRWIGTDNGIALYDAVSAARFLPLLTATALSPAPVMGAAYFDDASDACFVCSVQPAAVFVIPANGKAIKKITTDQAGAPLSSCNNIGSDREGNIWLMTDRHIYRYDRGQGGFVKFPAPNKGTDVGFRTFLQDEDGNYWFGSSLESIFFYNKEKKQFIAKDFPFVPFTKKIGSLRLDTFQHRVWISAYSSDVISYDLRSDKMEGYEDRPGLSALNLVNDILPDSRGNIWMATGGSGIIQFEPGQPPGKSFRHYNMKSGLPENSYMSMCEDAAGHIWLLSERGFTGIDSSGRPLNNRESDGSFGISIYTSDTRSPHSISYNRKGNEILAAVNGGLYLKSLAKQGDNFPFNLVITAVRTGSSDSAEYKPTDIIPAQLPYRFNSLQIEFAALYYGPPEKITVEYMLSGYDPQWISNSNYTAAYQNLPPGSYQFLLRAKYTDGKIAGQVSGSLFEIKPPIWKTTWFIAGLIFLIAAAILLLLYRLMQKLKAEKINNVFATSLYGQNSIEDICWDITRNCIAKLGFTDCVIYQYEEERKLLVQKAASGPKNPWQREIYNSLAIPLGKGIVGAVALTGKMINTGDTFTDPRYIVDDERRRSEIAVPVFIDGKLFGVLDSEHPEKNFYSRFHETMLCKIAGLCAERIARYQSEERLRGKIARDLHDEMGSTLTSIDIMCKVALQESNMGNKAGDYLQKIRDNAGRMLDSISDMVWVINPANDNFEKLLFRMKEFAGEILDPLQINYQFTEQGELQAIPLNPEQRKEIYLIFKEALTNAVRYSNTTELFISLREKEGNFEMEVTDTGCGFEPLPSGRGNGLRNMQARAAAIGGEVKIDSQKGTGSRIALHLRLTPSGYDNKPV